MQVRILSDAQKKRDSNRSLFFLCNFVISTLLLHCPLPSDSLGTKELSSSLS